MEQLNAIITKIDDFVWGPVMLILLVGTGIFLTIRTRFLTWRNLGYALKSTLSKEARTKSRGEGDVSPFSALTTALAATIGTGNIVGVATAMVSGGLGALVWMWISAAFGLTSKFSECMLAIKYREVNEKGEMSGGPMYTMKKGIKNKTLGSALAWLFALFAVIASFGIGNKTQGNSISGALHATFHIPTWITGIVITVLACNNRDYIICIFYNPRMGISWRKSILELGFTQTLNLVWSFSDIANALMAIPNLICMLILSKEVAQDIKAFQPEIDNRHTEKRSSSDACLQDTK